jgi:UDP-N-acetylmuramoyl-tripeptide--D-alanyl-D-alanine ligase
MATAIPANQASFELAEAAACCGGQVSAAGSGVRFSGITTDSRAVQPGQLYVALRGERFDGHAFLDDALAKGAAAALVSVGDDARAPGLPRIVVDDTRRALGWLGRLHRTRWGGKLIAITGSAGKTTTKELTAAALRGLGHRVLATQGNLNNDIGLPMTLFQLTDQHDLAVVEIGTNAPGEIAWLADVAQPQVGVVTTVSLAHTERLGSLDGVADEKTALLRALPREGVAIYGSDSEPLRARAPGFGPEQRFGFGREAGADLKLIRIAIGVDFSTEVRWTLQGDPTERSFELALGGVAAALDALAALGVVLGIYGEASLAAAAAGMRSVQPLPGRMRPRKSSHGALVIDDTYNANPASMSASLRTLSELARVRGGRAVAALADMAELGSHSQAEHERIGREVVDLGLSDVFFCGRESAVAAKTARDEVRARRAKGPRVVHVEDPLGCVSELTRLLGPRDAVLVKGSRALAMERVVEALSPEEGDPP